MDQHKICYNKSVFKLSDSATPVQNDIFYKNIKLYYDALNSININYKGNAGIFHACDMSISDLYLTIDHNKFMSVYPYEEKWAKYAQLI